MLVSKIPPIRGGLQKAILPSLYFVSAMAVANDSASVVQLQQQLGMPEELQLLPPINPEPMTALPEAVGDYVTVASVRFVGQQEQVAYAELENLVAEALGKDLDITGLQALSERVTDYFKSQGWILTRAYLPEQDVTDGVITIAIVPGVLSKARPVSVMPQPPHASHPIKLIEAIAAKHVVPGKSVHEADLDEAMLLINDLPGVGASSYLQPGQESGSTEIVIELDDPERISGVGWVDNYGAAFTGTQRGNLSLQWNNPLGFGDQTGFLMTASKGTKSYQFSYGAPVGTNGSRWLTSFESLTYEAITGVGLSNNVEGSASTMKFAWTSPLQRSQLINQNIDLDLKRVTSKDYFQRLVLAEKENLAGRVTYSGNYTDAWQGGGLSSWRLGLVMGDLSLPVGAQSDLYGVADTYNKVEYSFSRLQSVVGNLTAYASLNGQMTGQNLDGSEQFSLGGPSGVRAYPVGEGSGDSGFISSFELRYDMPDLTGFGHLQMQAFYDFGHTQLHNDPKGIPLTTATQKNEYDISGVGLGVTLTKRNNYQVNALWATKLGDNPGRDSNGNDADGFANKQRFLMQVNVWF